MISLLSFALIALIGCASGNDSAKKDISLPDKWAEASANPSFTTADTSGSIAWWQSFNDPNLSGLVEKGLKYNHDIKIASLKLKQARAVKRGISSGLWPQLDSTATYKRTGSGSESVRSDYINPSGSSTDYREYDNFRAGFDSSWEIDLWGGKRLEVEASDADIKASEAERAGTCLSVSAEIADNYFSLRSVQDQKELAISNLKAQKSIFEITEKKYRAGLASSLDKVSASAKVASSEAKIPELEAKEKGLVYALSFLTGDSYDALAKLARNELVKPSPPKIPVGLPSDLLKRRPDIIKAEAQLDAATARTGASRKEYFPKITLTGSFAYSGSDADSFLNWSSRSWYFGPAVSLPIFNAGRISANIESKSAAEEQAAANYEKIVLTAFKEAETSFSNYSRNLEKHVHFAKAAKENSDAAEMSLKLYDEGLIDYSRVLEARQAQYSAEEALVVSNASLATDLVSIFKSLGGGWSSQ